MTNSVQTFHTSEKYFIGTLFPHSLTPQLNDKEANNHTNR